MLTREQVRMARAALKWGVRDLAVQSGVTANTISRFENGADAYGDTLAKIERTLEAAGVTFIAEGEPSSGGGAGVRLREQE